MEGVLPYIHRHIAVVLDQSIVVLGGYTWTSAHDFVGKSHDVWLYSLILEQWRKYQIPKYKEAPRLVDACAVVIGKDIITFGGGKPDVVTMIENNELWKLTRNTNVSFEWNRILKKHNKKAPSPRIGHRGWEYDGKL